MNDDEPEFRILTHEELVDRARAVAQFAIEQCGDEEPGPFVLLSSMAVLLSAAASLATLGRVEPESAIGIFKELLNAHYETARKEAN